MCNQDEMVSTDITKIPWQGLVVVGLDLQVETKKRAENRDPKTILLINDRCSKPLTNVNIYESLLIGRK